MQNNNFLSRDKTQALIDGLEIKQADGKAFLDGLVAKGYTIEGYNDQPKPAISTRSDGAFDPNSNIKESAKGFVKGAIETVADMGGFVNQGLNKGANALGIVTPQGQEAQIAQAQSAQDLNTALEPSNPQQEAGKVLEKMTEFIAPTRTAQKAVVNTAKGALEVGQALSKVPSKAVIGVEKGVKKGANIIKEGINPTPTLEKAIGEASIAKKVSQLPKFEKAISGIDVKGIKTFAELNDRFKKAIPSISAKVDSELLKDSNLYKIDDLLIPQATKSGKEIKVDYITRSLDGLKDLYAKLGDDVAKADIDELANKAVSQGLTRKEVNDLARLYNTEYGSKAFTATGDIKTGFNAEVYESTRKGLKDIARSGLGGDEAKALDDTLSSIYDAQKLTENNVNQVNALKQRIEEKGWIGTGIRKAFEASDLITGGAVRAIRDTVLARGNAQKLQNVYELEKSLQKNLEVISKAMKAKTEAEATKILKTLSSKKK